MRSSFCGLAFEQSGDGDAGPAADDVGDLLGVHLFLEQGALALHGDEALFGEADIFLELAQLAIAQTGGLVQVGGALGALHLRASLVELLFQGAATR